MAVYKRDIVDINLETGNIHRSFLKHSIGYKDQKADHFGIRTYRDGVPVDLTGVSVQGIFLPPHGDPIAITSGNIVDGNVAEVVLPQACYNYDGQFCLSIKLVDSNNSVTGTMRIVDGMVDNTHASGTVAPTAAVPTYQEILATYEAMLAATTAATTAATNVGSIVAAAYSTSATYAVGDYCTKDGNLYRCTTAITTAESWTAAHWTQTKMGSDVSDLKSALNDCLDVTFYTSPRYSAYVIRYTIPNVKTGNILHVITNDAAGLGMKVYNNSDYSSSHVVRNLSLDDFEAKQDYDNLYLAVLHMDSSAISDASVAGTSVVKFYDYNELIKALENNTFALINGKYFIPYRQSNYALRCTLSNIKKRQTIHIVTNDTSPLYMTVYNNSDYSSSHRIREASTDDFVADQNYTNLYISIIHQGGSTTISDNVLYNTQVNVFYNYNAMFTNVDGQIDGIIHQTRYIPTKYSSYVLRCTVSNVKKGQTIHVDTTDTTPLGMTIYPTSSYSGNKVRAFSLDDFIAEQDYTNLYLAILHQDTSITVSDYVANTTIVKQYYDYANSSASNLTGQDIPMSNNDSTKVSNAINGISDRLPSGNGTSGQVLKTNGDGTSEWSNASMPTDQQIAEAVGDYLDDHPGAITQAENLIYVDKYASLVEEIHHPNGNTYNDWSPAINAAINDAGVGGEVVFSPGKLYTISRGVQYKKGQTIQGNGATLKRNYPILYSLASSASPSATTLTVTESASALKVGDKVCLYDGNTINDVVSTLKITAISGSTITLQNAIGGSKTFAAGSTVAIDFNMMGGSQYPTPYNAKILNLCFDGSSDVYDGANDGNYYWYLNTALSVYGYGSVVDGCKFINIPNECIVTHGSAIVNCSARNLNGSFVHLSCPATSLLDSGELQYINTVISNNIVIASNLIDNAKTGHSMAVIEQSWNGGNISVSNNRFDGGIMVDGDIVKSKGICYDLGKKNASDGVSNFSNVIIIGNYYNNYSKICNNIGSSETGDIIGKIMSNNIFRDCGSVDLSGLGNFTTVQFLNNVYLGDTTVTTS